MTGSLDGWATCPSCRDQVAVRRFDLAVANGDGRERAFFGIPASLCGTCGWLSLDRDAERLFRFVSEDVTFAIQSDSCLLESEGRDAA
jgi:hypothetical protein